MSLHGSGGSGRNNAKSSRWVQVAEKAGAIALFPSALRVCLEREGGREIKPFWQTRGKQLMLCEGQERYEDTDFLLAALDWAAERFEIDQDRIYVSGFSNGCGLIQQNIIPELSDRFAAAGCVGSLMRPVSMGGTIPERRGRPIPLFLMIGQRDPHFTGPDDRPLPLSGKALLANELVSGSIAILLELLDLEAEPTERKSDLGHLMTFDRSREGESSQQLRFAVMKGVKHSFPTGGKKHNGIVAARVHWNFFVEQEGVPGAAAP